VYDSASPQTASLPAHLASLERFQRLLVLRCMRPDKVVPAVQALVEEALGRQYVEPPAFDLAACYADSSPTTPLIFVLSAGSDPTATLLQFAGRGAQQALQSCAVVCALRTASRTPSTSSWVGAMASSK
jgi:dynein heavy chain